MYVITRDGKKTPIRYDKITDRNVEFASDLNVDVVKLSKAVIAGLKDGMHTSEIDNLSAETAFYMSTYEPEFDKLAVRIAVSNLHKSTNASFSETIRLLKEYINPKTGKSLNIISDRFYNFVQKNKEILDSSIIGTRDFKFSYFGFKTLQRSYLLKCENKIVERPQYMWMRVACGIHMPDKDEYTEEENNQSVEKALKSYELMSQFYFTHASPTLFNAGSNSPQCSSCFLMTMDDDLKHIYTTNYRSAIISKHAGGIGIDITRVRSKGSVIHSTNGKSNGIVPMIKVFNSTALYCDQAGKRKGSIAMYLEPWHPDVLDFLQLRFNLPPEDIRARDIFIAMWVNDLFMKRVEKDEMWSLFCPNSVPKLTETYGDEFESIYLQAEKEGKFVKQIKAQEVWKAILHSQTETGLPYMCYKDHVNKKSNQKNLGIVRSSNLCTEICEVTENSSVAVCNLSSIGLPAYVDQNKRSFDYIKLGEVVEIITENLNKVIDINFYPLEEAKTNNLSYRPIGIGIQGLADVFALLDYYWGDDGSKRVNRLIMETIYYHALKRSCELAKKDGPYDGFYGSPASQGILQYHMWNTTPLSSEKDCEIQLDWNTLIEDIKKYGLRNSLLVAPMPTASTSQIMANNECLTGDTLISLSNGLSVKIEDFISNNKVLSFNENDKVINSSEKINLLNQGIKPVIEISFQDGTNIKCTKDHMFLTNEGWKEAKDLLNKKIISSYKGVLDIKNEDENDFLINIKPNILTMKNDREKILALSRIIGYITGDGHIEKNSKNMSMYFGSKQDAETFFNDLSLFSSFKPKIQQNTRGLLVSIPIDLKNILKQFNLTEGRKSTSPYKHPLFILQDNCPLSVIREYLAGHFGADGISPSLCKPKKQTSFISPMALSHEIDECNVDSLKLYMEQIQSLLLKFNITSTIKGPYLSTTERIRTEQKFYKIIVSLTPKSTFGEKIGFRYCWSKMLRCCIGTSYYKYRENVLKQKKEFSDYVDNSDLSVKKSIQKLKKEYKEPILYGTMLKENYKRNRGTNTNLKNFKGYSALEYLNLLNAIKFFEDPYFIKDDKSHIALPTFELTVIHIKELNKCEQVYDISVNNTHNFIANSVVVHNCFEPFTTNIFSRSTLAGDFTIVNKHLYSDLKKLNIWTSQLVDQILAADGSIQHIKEIPEHIRNKYKTVWELSQKITIDYAADRAPFVDQSQSLNLYLDYPTSAKLTSMHFYGWKKGLKTGSYYIHSKPSRSAVKFTVSNESVKSINKTNTPQIQPQPQSQSSVKKFVCVGEDGCLSCGS